MNESFNSLIDSASSILILLPSKPYFDQVAAGLSLYLSIHDKKPVTISCPSPITVGFNRLIGVNKIGQEVGDKNLLITFPNYDSGNIEKVSYDIENGQFKLTVVPKTGFSSPQGDQVQIGYVGGSADLIILVGGANESHFPSLSEKSMEGARVVHVGTRALVSDRGIMSFAKPGSSASELVASLIKENNLPMDVDVATNLVMGIEEGSLNFTSSEVTPETFEVFAHLLRNGGQRQPKVKLSPMNFPVGSIPTQPYAKPTKQEIPQATIETPAEQVESKEETVENPPSDWLQPKVYKGTSIS
jgi:hypothetical protein